MTTTENTAINTVETEVQSLINVSLEDLRQIWDDINLPYHVSSQLDGIASEKGLQSAINATLLTLAHIEKASVNDTERIEKSIADVLKETGTETTSTFFSEQIAKLFNSVIDHIFELVRIVLDSTAFLSLISKSIIGNLFGAIPVDIISTIIILVLSTCGYIVIFKIRSIQVKKQAAKTIKQAANSKQAVIQHTSVNDIVSSHISK